MKKYALILGMVVCLVANTKTGIQSGREFQIKRHNINQVEMCISNFGKFGQDETGYNAGCWWPIGTDHNYIYGAGIWFGTIDAGDTLVTIGYGPSGGQSECVPGLKDMPISHPNAIIYMYPDPWPAPQDTFPMAPQDTVSHQDSWCCFNDCDSNLHMPGDTRPIGIELYQTVYAWDISEIEDIIFFTYEVKNVSGHDLQDCYIGICTDNDIGNEAGMGNDICTGIIDRTYVINNDTIIVDNLGYQWQEQQEPGWDSFPGVIGFDLLQTPFDLVEGQDKDNDGIPDQYERDSAYYVNMLPQYMWDVDEDGVPDWRDASENPQVGMTAFKITTLDLEPHIDSERYLTLAGYNYQTGIYEPYDTIIPDPDDQRFLMASGPLDLEPDSSVTFVFAVLLADWHNIYQTPDSALALVDKWAQLYYDMYWFLYTGIDEHQNTKLLPVNLEICPNPFNEKTSIRFQITDNTNATMEIFDVTGRLIRQFDYPTMRQSDQISWDGRDNMGKKLPSGVYFLKLVTGDYSATEKLLLIR